MGLKTLKLRIAMNGNPQLQAMSSMAGEHLQVRMLTRLLVYAAEAAVGLPATPSCAAPWRHLHRSFASFTGPNSYRIQNRGYKDLAIPNFTIAFATSGANDGRNDRVFHVVAYYGAD